MKAFGIQEYKGAIVALEVPEPVPGPDEVLISVKAASINPVDRKIARGDFKLFLDYKPPFALGFDCAGIIESVGSEVKDYKPGDEVFTRVPDSHIGTFAQKVAVPAHAIALKPKNFSMEEAASLPLVSLTAWQALVDTAGIRSDSKVFIHGGSGAVGSVAIQLAKHIGAYVATTASAENIPYVRSLGADHIIDYTKEDFSHILAGQDYDMVLDILGAEAIIKAADIVRPGGTIVGINGPIDKAFAQEQKLNAFYRFMINRMSSTLRKTMKAKKVNYKFLLMHADGERLKHLGLLMSEGIIRPHVSKIFPFQNTPQAMEWKGNGKAVIRMDNP